MQLSKALAREISKKKGKNPNSTYRNQCNHIDPSEVQSRGKSCVMGRPQHSNKRGQKEALGKWESLVPRLTDDHA